MLNKRLKFTLYHFIIYHYLSKTSWILGVFWLVLLISNVTNQLTPEKLLCLYLFLIMTFEVFECLTHVSFKTINLSKTSKLILSYLLLKKHHSSSKLNLELNKLKQAIENKSQLYNDLNKNDFPYINKFISRYYHYKNHSHKKNNHTLIKNVVKDDLLQLSKYELNTKSLMLENTSSFEQLDDVLGNLVKEQIKQKTVVTNK